MKVWLTRPHSQRYYSRGFSHVKLWVEKPVFDHRPMQDQFELKDRVTGEYKGCVSSENGWFSRAAPTRAKGFIGQDPELLKRACVMIYASLVPLGHPEPYRELTEEEHQRWYYDSDYEMKCMTHWKRFLLEVDLCQKTVIQIEPKAIVTKDSPAEYGHPITRRLDANYWVDEDMSRPFTYDDPQYHGFDRCVERIDRW